MKSALNWTVGIVNYHSSIYLRYILQALYEFNDVKLFNVVIVDNSRPNENHELSALAEQYKSFQNIEVVFAQSSVENPSVQHGNALNEILRKTSSKYLLIQDPDFFFVQKNYLEKFESYFSEGCVAAGAPYKLSKNILTGNKDFPAAFGCAYLREALLDLDFSASADASEISQIGRDVGWRIRERLSSQKYLSFRQVQSKLGVELGVFSYDVDPYEYYDSCGVKIAYHLFKGSRGNVIPKSVRHGFDGTTLSGYEEFVDLSENRNRYGRYFYDEIRNFTSA